MPTSPSHATRKAGLDLAELSLELARLDLTRSAKLGEQIVDLLVRHFMTDRISLILPGDGQPVAKAFFTGFDVPVKQWADSSEIIQRVLSTGQPVIVHNVREFPEFAAAQQSVYRTDAFAVYPLKLRKKIEGVLCLSNLSTQQLLQLENSGLALDIVLAQLAQLCRMLGQGQASRSTTKPAIDELALVGRLFERLEENSDTRDVLAVFGEVISALMPTEVIAVIHDRIREPQAAVVSVHRPVHVTELENVFASIAHQWQRRHKRAPSLSLSDARVLNQELVCSDGECTPELKLNATEVFPIFLDNDLFALVCVATTEEAIGDRRALMAFSLMAHQLFTFIKKRILLAQNSEMQTQDSLTGLMNERQFYNLLEREFDRATRYSTALSLLFIDIDHFKDINDSYGFEVGDRVLLDLARIIGENMRSTDFVSRYSGERFVLVLPETPYKNAEVMANRLRRYVENHSFFIPNSDVFIKVTASIGVASYLDHKPASVAQFIEYADTALYFAKRNGRNQVVGYSYVINLMCGETKHKG